MPTITVLHVLLASLLVSPSFAALFTKPSQLPRTHYDYVIVGGGNAGGVLASRLSEDSGNKVLVLEAGPSNQGVLASVVPFLGPSLTPGTPYDWNYTVTPQTHLDGRSFPFPRGRILGGCSSVNYMVHQYGSAEDFNRIASVAGDSTWSWNSVKPMINRHEKIVPPVDGHDTTGQYIPANHGTNGILPVSLPGNVQSMDARVIATTQELSNEFPYNSDMGGGNNVLGIGWVQSSIGGGKRSSSATTYIAAAINRPNLHVLVNAQVTKLVSTGNVQGKPAFRSVKYQTGPNSATYTVYGDKEVILSAGTFSTPQILLLSGIGPSADLQALHIPVIVNNPSVGKNLSDHVLLPNIFNVQNTDGLDNLIRDQNIFTAALDQWTNFKTGPLANGIVNQLGFLRLPSTASIFNTVPDPAAGPASSHWEMIFANFWLNPSMALPATGNYITIIAALISPTSRGTVKLQSTNAWAKPLIDLNFLSTAFDVFAMRETVRAVKRFTAANSWAGYILGYALPGLSGTTDAQIDAYVRDQSTTMYHPVGTASMSPYGARWGVVNPDLTVKGTVGLRVVDASVLPFVPNAHTQGPTYLLAEKAATLF